MMMIGNNSDDGEQWLMIIMMNGDGFHSAFPTLALGIAHYY